MDVVASGVLPDKRRMMRAEVVKDNDEPFPWIYLLIRSQYLSNIFLPGALPKRGNGGAINGKNGEGIGPDLCCIFQERSAVERPRPLGIGRGLGRALIEEPEHGMLAHPRKFFLRCASASTGLR